MLEFNVTNQTLKRVDKFSPATDSVDYLTAKFNFLTEDWDGKAKKALFRSGTVSYEAAIGESGTCVVPWETLVAPESKFSTLSGGCVKIYVTVVGTLNTVTLPTKECRVEIAVSGLTETLNGAEPTPDIYEQFVTTVQADNDATVAEIRNDNDETAAEINANNADTVAAVDALAERAETAATSAENSAASMKNDYANALKGMASGEVVRVDDVSPVEHTPIVKVRSKNLIPYPYFSKDALELDGITYAIDNDGKITISGTNEKGTNWYLARNFNLEKGSFVFSYSGDLSGVNILLYCPSKQLLLEGLTEHKKTAPIVIDETMPDCNIYINIDKIGTTVGGSFYVQLEKGDTATEYTPYVDPSTVTVTRCGKNLISPPYAHSSGYTSNGVTFTVQEDGAVVINGTPTNTTEFLFERALKLPVGIYTYRLFGVELAPEMCSGVVNQYNGEVWRKGLGSDRGTGVTFEITEADTEYVIRTNVYVLASGKTFTNFRVSPMLCVGNVVGAYEQYNGATYTPAADGSCDVVSVSPTMTLLTDTEGVTVDLEYNRDINRVIADILTKLG